jgi:hypothetical protein
LCKRARLALPAIVGIPIAIIDKQVNANRGRNLVEKHQESGGSQKIVDALAAYLRDLGR